MVSIEKETLLDTVELLRDQEKEQHALVVLRVAIEKSLRHMGMYTPIVSQLPFICPKKEQLEELKKLESQIRKEFATSSKEVVFEKVLDYLHLISEITEDPGYSYRKLMASILARKSIKGIRVSRRTNGIGQHMAEELLAEGRIQIPRLESSQEEKKYYTTGEAAKKLGLSDQTIRRMCERGKFKGASRVGGSGHWRIPEENFITTSEQDKEAEMILQRIDKKNEKAGDIDEFDL